MALYDSMPPINVPFFINRELCTHNWIFWKLLKRYNPLTIPSFIAQGCIIVPKVNLISWFLRELAQNRYTIRFIANNFGDSHSLNRCGQEDSCCRKRNKLPKWVRELLFKNTRLINNEFYKVLFIFCTQNRSISQYPCVGIAGCHGPLGKCSELGCIKLQNSYFIKRAFFE